MREASSSSRAIIIQQDEMYKSDTTSTAETRPFISVEAALPYSIHMITFFLARGGGPVSVFDNDINENDAKDDIRQFKHQTQTRTVITLNSPNRNV